MKKNLVNILLVVWIIALTALIGYNFMNNLKMNKNLEKVETFNAIKNIDTQLTLTGDKQYKLSEVLSDTKTENTMLVFFSPECEACNIEIAALEELRKNNGLKMKVMLIGVGSEFKIIENYMLKKGLEYEFYATGWDEYYQYIGSNFVPLTLIVNREGKVNFSKSGWGGSKDVKIIKETIKDYQ